MSGLGRGDRKRRGLIKNRRNHGRRASRKKDKDKNRESKKSIGKKSERHAYRKCEMKRDREMGDERLDRGKSDSKKRQACDSAGRGTGCKRAATRRDRQPRSGNRERIAGAGKANA